MFAGLILRDAPQRADSPRPALRPKTWLRRKGAWSWAGWTVRIPVALYLVVAAVLSSIQTRLIFPGAETQGQPSAMVPPRPGEELVSLSTPRGDRVVALFGPALTPEGQPHPDATHSPTLLYFHGNGMCLHDTSYEFERFRKLGLNVLIPEYVGYGMSTGRPSESGCYATADAAYAHLLQRKDIDPRKIVVGGWSPGGAVALDLAARERVAGLVALSTFTSMVDMARRTFPFLPASLLLRHRFDNQKKIPRVTCPILIGHGRLDQLIPYEMSERLTALARVPVMRLSIDDAGHNDFFAVGGDRIFEAVRTFLEQLAPTR